MSARDTYKVRLHCLFCGLDAVANMSENDGWTYLRGNVDKRMDSSEPPGVQWVDRPRREEPMLHRDGYRVGTLVIDHAYVCPCGSDMESGTLV